MRQAEGDDAGLKACENRYTPDRDACEGIDTCCSWVFGECKHSHNPSCDYSGADGGGGDGGDYTWDNVPSAALVAFLGIFFGIGACGMMCAPTCIKRHHTEGKLYQATGVDRRGVVTEKHHRISSDRESGKIYSYMVTAQYDTVAETGAVVRVEKQWRVDNSVYEECKDGEPMLIRTLPGEKYGAYPDAEVQKMAADSHGKLVFAFMIVFGIFAAVGTIPSVNIRHSSC